MTAAQKTALEAALYELKILQEKYTVSGGLCPEPRPYDGKELIARIEEVLAEKEPEAPELLSLGMSMLQTARHQALVAEALQDLPERIKEQGKAIADLSFSIDEQRYNIERIKNDHLQIILVAKDDKGKSVYSNAEMRDIAIGSRLLADTDYQDRKKKLSEDERKLSDSRLHLEYLNNKLKTALALNHLLEVR